MGRAPTLWCSVTLIRFALFMLADIQSHVVQVGKSSRSRHSPRGCCEDIRERLSGCPCGASSVCNCSFYQQQCLIRFPCEQQRCPLPSIYTWPYPRLLEAPHALVTCMADSRGEWHKCDGEIGEGVHLNRRRGCLASTGKSDSEPQLACIAGCCLRWGILWNRNGLRFGAPKVGAECNSPIEGPLCLQGDK